MFILGRKSSKTIFLKIVGMGILMGLLFPFYVGIFIDIPRNTWLIFGVSCVSAGAIVGIINYYVTLSVIKSLENEEERAKTLEKAVHIDHLTGLLNRQSFDLAVSQINLGGCNEPLTIGFIDIDNFGQLNKKYGHLRGDSILKRIAEIILENIRNSDKSYRYGGEEIVIFFHNTIPETGELICRRLKETIEHTEFGIPGRVTVSIGLSYFGKDCSIVEEAVGRADDAMYQAKEKGKNSLVINCYNYNVL